MTRAYLQVMVRLWGKDRVLTRRIHGLAAADPELGTALGRRNQRKKMAIGRVLEAIERHKQEAWTTEERRYHQSVLWAFTSFEVFDQLAQHLPSEEAVSKAVVLAVGRALQLDLAKKSVDG